MDVASFPFRRNHRDVFIVGTGDCAQKVKQTLSWLRVKVTDQISASELENRIYEIRSDFVDPYFIVADEKMEESTDFVSYLDIKTWAMDLFHFPETMHAYRDFIRITFDDFMISEFCTKNGLHMRMGTHRQDLVLGEMVRGNMRFCPMLNLEIDNLQRHITPHANLLDAGANIGLVTIPNALQELTATIYSVEPDPTNFFILRLNMILNDVRNVHLFHCAIGKEVDTIRMFLSASNFGDHRSVVPHEKDLGRMEATSFLVPKFNLYHLDFFQKKQLKFDFVKIKTQGTDVEILESILEMIQPEAMVSLAFSPNHISENGTTNVFIRHVLEQFDILGTIEKSSPDQLVTADLEGICAYFEKGSIEYKGYCDIVLRKKLKTEILIS